MANVFGTIQRAMSIDTDLVRLIADNIANAQTPNFQRKLGVQRVEFSAVDAATGIASQTSQLAPLETAADVTPGTLSETHESLDIALSGPGSLFVSTQTGETTFRGGRLHISDDDVLVTQAGDPVLGVSGPITFPGGTVDQKSIAITSDGVVKVAGISIGQLRVQAADGTDEGIPHVVQGFLEGSNVNSVTEMVKLMEVIRHFESGQRAMRSYDGLMQQAISDLGKI